MDAAEGHRCGKSPSCWFWIYFVGHKLNPEHPKEESKASGLIVYASDDATLT